jgi:hypothetical protein
LLPLKNGLQEETINNRSAQITSSFGKIRRRTCAKACNGNGLRNMGTRTKEIGCSIYIQAAYGVIIQLQKE